MTNFDRLYTKNGDNGMTCLGNGKQIKKDDPRIIACGFIDELNSCLGIALTFIKKSNEFNTLKDNINRIQEELIQLNAQLALAYKAEKITILHVQNLEKEIDEMHNTLPPLAKFIVPGGNEMSAFLHFARTVCRRAEIAAIKLENDVKNSVFIPYLNRLSDWLFTAARFTEIQNEKE